MIKHLILNNLVLVDTCEIHFGPRFNAITGETGAGKTALIEAISLALGSRADSSLIRKGCERAFVEIAFDVEHLPHVRQTLEDAGIALDADELLTIRREIALEGRNRAFVNCRTVPLPLLQKIGEQLIDLISQSAHHALRANDSQRALVDLFGSLENPLNAFQCAYLKEREWLEKHNALQLLSQNRVRDEDTFRFQLDEITSAAVKKGEEEALFEKYQRLAHAQEMNEKIDLILKGLSETTLPQIGRFYKSCESLQNYDCSFAETSQLFREAQIALSEALRSLQSVSHTLESDPNTLQFLESRLSTITKLKRKYGQTFEEIGAFRAKLESELARLENLSHEISCSETQLKEAHAATDDAAHHLSAKRKEAAAQLQHLLTSHLHTLNMPGAEVAIAVSEQARHHTGDDLIQFYLKANTGEHPGLVKEHASGGELSRLLFAIKIALAEKNDTPTLIFDEIDANVGGKTAATIASELKKLGAYRQIICITHFPQVASQADTHYSVQKVAREGRTLTEIKPLNKKEREHEMLRMIGGRQLSASQ